MKAYERVYKIENGELVKNTENKLEYLEKGGKRRVKTNPSIGDFIKFGYYPLSNEAGKTLESGRDVKFIVRNDAIYPIDCEVTK